MWLDTINIKAKPSKLSKPFDYFFAFLCADVLFVDTTRMFVEYMRDKNKKVYFFAFALTFFIVVMNSGECYVTT